MAEKRMFARKIIDSDAFLEMPLSAQALYFHLNMRADDDGFVNNPKRITDYVNASVDDLKILLTKRFVIGFESGVIVIRHWKIHNTIKSDRYRLTDYQEELARLLIEPSKAYSEAPPLPQLSQARTDQFPVLRPERCVEDAYIRILLAAVQGLSIAQTGETPLGTNTVVSLLESTADGWRVIFRDDASHLPPSVRQGLLRRIARAHPRDSRQ